MMIKSGLVASLIFLGWIGTLRAEAPRLECPPDFTADSLEDFRDAAIANIIAGNYAPTKEKFGSCFPDGLPKCLEDAAYFNGLKMSGSGTSSYSSNLMEDYEQDVGEANTLKSEKDLPPEFFSADKPGIVKIPLDLENLAKRKGWKVISYKTRSTGGFDKPPNLTLISIPGPDKDIHLQISPPPGPEAKAQTNDPKPQLGHDGISKGQATLTIITVDKKVSPPIGQLRLLNGYGTQGEYRWVKTTRSQSCLGCHASPLRSISPRGYKVTNGAEKRMSPQDERTVDEINRMMVVDGLKWGEVTKPTGKVRLGPAIDTQPLGWAPPNSPTRKTDFIKECSKRSTAIDYVSIGSEMANDDLYRFSQTAQNMDNIDHTKVATHMNCTQCHNGGIRGTLGTRFSLDEIKFKILVDRSMPPGANLSADERLALYNCLVAEREQVSDKWRSRGEWMRKMACQTIPPRRRPARPAAPPTNSTTTD